MHGVEAVETLKHPPDTHTPLNRFLSSGESLTFANPSQVKAIVSFPQVNSELLTDTRQVKTVAVECEESSPFRKLA
jgi:hypothetical protein